jgi:hypothetical protein
MANSDANGATAEFPYGDQTALCQFEARSPHSLYGNGLLVTQTFPVNGLGETEGRNLALKMNRIELGNDTSGVGLGSFRFSDDGVPQFVSFFPNAAFRPGLTANIYMSCAARTLLIKPRIEEEVAKLKS